MPVILQLVRHYRMSLQLISTEFDFLIGVIDSVLEKTSHTFEQQSVPRITHDEKTNAEALQTWEGEGGAVRLNSAPISPPITFPFH